MISSETLLAIARWWSVIVLVVMTAAIALNWRTLRAVMRARLAQDAAERAERRRRREKLAS